MFPEVNTNLKNEPEAIPRESLKCSCLLNEMNTERKGKEYWREVNKHMNNYNVKHLPGPGGRGGGCSKVRKKRKKNILDRCSQ